MNPRLFAAAFVALSVLALLPVGSQAQTVGQLGLQFGTQVNSGQPDFIPIAKKSFTDSALEDKDNAAILVLRKELGDASQVIDDGFYFDLEVRDATPTLDFEDLRITPVLGKASGSFLADADTVEKGAVTVATDCYRLANAALYSAAVAAACVLTIRLVYADVNNNGRYDANDLVFLTTSNTGLAATVSTTAWTLRLTPANGKAAGTHVFAADADFTGYGTTVIAFPFGYVVDFEGGRHNLVFAQIQRNALAPQFSLRVKNNDAAGAFGTQVKAGSTDFLPQANYGVGPTVTGIAAAANIATPASVRVGPTGIYSSAATTLAVADIRLVSYIPGLAPGALAADDPDVGLTVATPSAATIPVTAIADVDGGGTVTAGDLPLQSGVAGAGLATDVAYRSTNRILQLDLGSANEVGDNCFFLDSDGSGTLNNFDVRLLACQGKAAGTLVSDGDTVEKSATPVAATTYALVFADINNNGRYDAGDQVYLTRAAYAAGNDPFVASTSTTVHTIRLTPGAGKAAGTLVFAVDSDFTSYSTATRGVALGFQFFDADMSSNGRLTAGDSAYLLPAAATNLRAKLFAINSLRLTTENVAGAFGSQVAFGASDFRPTIQLIADPDGAGALAAGGIVFLRAPLGDAAVITDDCIYASVVNQGAATYQLDAFDIRLTDCQGKKAGTLVTDQDVVEKNAIGLGAAAEAHRIGVADANPDGSYKLDDYLFMVVGGATPALRDSTAPASYSLRLSNNPGGLAGTFVRASQIDFQAFQNAAPTNGNFVMAFFDKDLSGGPSQGDLFYLALGFTGFGTGGPELVPRYSIRLSGDFGAITPATPSSSSTTTTAAPSSSSATTTASSTSSTQAVSTSTSASSSSAAAKSPGLELVGLLVALGAALVAVRRKM